MKRERINIGIIGAGQTGTPLIKKLADADFINIVAIADLDVEAPGITYAKEKGISVTTDLMDLAREGENIDIIIEVTGSLEVKNQLREYYKQNENRHTVIMQELVAILLMSLAQGELVKSHHGLQRYQ